MTSQDKSYGEQKNREHIWEQAKRRFEANSGVKYVVWRDEDSDIVNRDYEALCREARITPW